MFDSAVQADHGEKPSIVFPSYGPGVLQYRPARQEMPGMQQRHGARGEASYFMVVFETCSTGGK